MKFKILCLQMPYNIFLIALVTTYYYCDDMIGLWNIINFLPLLKSFLDFSVHFQATDTIFICITVSETYFADDMS